MTEALLEMVHQEVVCWRLLCSLLYSLMPLPLPLLSLPLQGTRHRESDRMARYGSSDEEDDEEATAEVVRCNNVHEML